MITTQEMSMATGMTQTEVEVFGFTVDTIMEPFVKRAAEGREASRDAFSFFFDQASKMMPETQIKVEW